MVYLCALFLLAITSLSYAGECPCYDSKYLALRKSNPDSLSQADFDFFLQAHELCEKCQYKRGIYFNPCRHLRYQLYHRTSLEQLSERQYTLLKYSRASCASFQNDHDYQLDLCRDSVFTALSRTAAELTGRPVEYFKQLEYECNREKRELKEDYAELMTKPVDVDTSIFVTERTPIRGTAFLYGSAGAAGLSVLFFSLGAVLQKNTNTSSGFQDVMASLFTFIFSYIGYEIGGVAAGFSIGLFTTGLILDNQYDNYQLEVESVKIFYKDYNLARPWRGDTLKVRSKFIK